MDAARGQKIPETSAKMAKFWGKPRNFCYFSEKKYQGQKTQTRVVVSKAITITDAKVLIYVTMRSVGRMRKRAGQ